MCKFKSDKTERSVTLIPLEYIDTNLDYYVPQINFEQLNVMAHQHYAANHNTVPWHNPYNPLLITNVFILSAIAHGYIKPCLAYMFLQKQSDWMNWALSNFKQLNQYYTRDMFKELVQHPPYCNVLPLVWTYLVKTDGIKKV